MSRASSPPPSDSSDDWSRSSSTTLEDCDAVLQGRVVPSIDQYRADGTDDMTKRLHFAVRYAIRRYLPYAQSTEVLMLCDQDAAITRARNARLIMSNIVPDMQQSSHHPYCIWYPDVAEEKTYRTLVARYPEMRYPVGRACAVAGYAQLYRELDILPEITIAEEARESGKGQAIFDDIMQSPLRYRAMDDYTRTVKPVAEPVAGLNGDTAVVAFMRYCRVSRLSVDPFCYFDIAEDGRIASNYDEDYQDEDNEMEEQAEDETEEESPSCCDRVFGPSDAWLLYSPLPRDLPAINKDLLILRAAWEGNVDRYARLRRPHELRWESACVVRGIYHSTAFAKWWYAQSDCPIPYLQAARSRFVMINEISWLRFKHPREENSTERYLPSYMIWWPRQPGKEVLWELVDREPRTRVQVAHAAINLGYIDLYRDLNIYPYHLLLEEANYSKNPEFLEHLEGEKGVKNVHDIAPDPNARSLVDPEKEISLSPATTSTVYPDMIDADRDPYAHEPEGLYLDTNLDFSLIEIYMAASVERLKESDIEQAAWRAEVGL